MINQAEAEAAEPMRSGTEPGPILCVVGARPNFMKIAPIMRALRGREDLPAAVLLHTGQHYDEDMKDSFFRQLEIPEPDVDLEVGSASHAVQTAEIMLRFEPVVDRLRPSAVLVVGDVNSTVACALVAAKKGIAVVHVEAGLRSFDRGMPEEINRVLTDQLSELLFTTEAGAAANLDKEGVAREKIVFVGNVMIDTLMHQRKAAVAALDTIGKHGSPEWATRCERQYCALTLHRPSNVDDPKVLATIADALAKISTWIPVVFSVHPRTRGAIDAAGLGHRFRQCPGLLMLPPLGYREMLGVMESAKFLMTDSGGMQEESTALGVPCLTLRENTERPITVEHGTNTVVGTCPESILAAVDDILKTGGKAGRVPERWDGRAADRIADSLSQWYTSRWANRNALP